MRAGRRDRRIIIQVRSETRGASGEVIEGWADLATVWAMKKDFRAGERFAAAQRIAEVDTVFEVVHNPALLVIAPDTHRIVFDSRIYHVLGLNEIGRKLSIEIMTAARQEAAFGA